MRAAMGSAQHTKLLEGLRPATLVQVLHAIAGFHANPMVSLRACLANPKRQQAPYPESSHACCRAVWTDHRFP